ncbi:M1-specific T cell receptor alpha chain-like isoform X2 [Pseudopipra pipra]|uniref:M1-specific T cell receptor alpha chain-like isoform X2 n=1 Tax=Pseudopipra pipra TaxID=415032 RepID=UPI003138C2F4
MGMAGQRLGKRCCSALLGFLLGKEMLWGSYSKVTFGSGTGLSIQPKAPPSPSAYRLTSKDDEDLEMCLITDYSPENIAFYTAEKATSAVVEVATAENSAESSYLSTYWARRDEMQCGASHVGFGELEGEDPESGTSTVCVTGLSLHFRTDEHLNTLSLSQLGLKIILMKGLIFNVVMTMLLWKKEN